MIVAKNLTKTFEDFTALDHINSTIPDGSIYGLVGSNGSGKSTLLRLISGIYRPDDGTLEVGGEAPYENINIKEQVLLVADDPFFFPGTTMNEMAKYYEGLFSTFDRKTYDFLCNNFPIEANKKIQNFSKGMKRQVALILALAAKPRYLLLDEAFDGLDPVMRGVLRKLLADAIAERDLTVLIASHNLRELEDLCDSMGLLHKGNIIFEREINEAKLGICKVQIAFTTPPEESIFQSLNVLSKEETGRVTSLIVRGNSSEIRTYLEQFQPLFVETIPLTLEEVFIYEMEAVGYDYNKILF